MLRPDWNERYTTDETPWDTGQPDENLVAFVASGAVPEEGRVIEIGCGTGTNALWLAKQGLQVVACDISERAIERAEAKRRDEPCRFLTLDFLSGALPEEPFDLAFDRGVFHVFDEAEERACFAERVASMLRPGAVWASLVGSTEGPPRDHGPPRRSLRDIADAVEPHLEIVELRRVMLTANIPSPAAGWWLVARAREVAPQPSTRR